MQEWPRAGASLAMLEKPSRACLGATGNCGTEITHWHGPFFHPLADEFGFKHSFGSGSSTQHQESLLYGIEFYPSLREVVNFAAWLAQVLVASSHQDFPGKWHSFG